MSINIVVLIKNIDKVILLFFLNSQHLLEIELMQQKPIFYILPSLLMILIMIVAIPAYSQERKNINRSKGFFMELGGSGVAVLTGNYDFRFFKGSNDGLGLRIGIGRESTKSKPLLGEGETKTKLFTLPLEINYVFGKRNFSFEIGYSLTYISETKNSSFRFFNPEYTITDESGSFFVSYLPVGFRLKPKTDGFMLKFNLGPLLNYSAPNVFYDDKIQFWAGLAVGFSFY